MNTQELLGTLGALREYGVKHKNTHALVTWEQLDAILAALRHEVELTKENRGKQAKIDALMLEYCPDEMTPEQLAEWGKRQRRASPEREAEIDAALYKESQT